MRISVRGASVVRRALAGGTAVAVAIVGAALSSPPEASAGLCACDFPPGPCKTWVMMDDATVGLLDQFGNPLVVIPVGGGCNSIVTKPDCSVVFVGTVGGPMKGPGICDIDCGTLQVVERDLPAPPIPNGIVCKGDQLWVALADGTVVVFDCTLPPTDPPIATITVGGGCNAILAKCFGNRVFVTTTGIPGVKGPGFCDIDCQTFQVTEQPLPIPPIPNGMWLTPDDSKLWIMLSDFSVWVFDCVSGQPLAQIPVGGACNSITGKCDGSTVFLGNVGGGVPQQWFPPVGFGPGQPPQPVIDSFS